MKNFITIMFLFFAFSVFAQDNENYTIVQKEGKKYYEYVVQPGEGIWGISKKFNVSQADIYKENPDATYGIKTGQILFIPIKKDNIKIDTSKKKTSDLVHVVLQQQTLYAISKIYGVSIDHLIELNPKAEQGIKVGDEIIIHKRDGADEDGLKEKEKGVKKILDITHIVEKKETLYSISKKYQVQIHDIITHNPQVKDALKVGMELIITNATVAPKKDASLSVEYKKNVADINTKETLKNNDDNIQKNETTIVSEPVVPLAKEEVYSKDKKAPVKIAVLLPFMSKEKFSNISLRKFVEMYKGMLLSMEMHKQAGRSFVVNTYDTHKSKNVLDSLFALSELQNADIIIGPANAEELPMVLNFAKKRNIPCIVPIANNIADELKYDNLVQFNPSLHDVVGNLQNEMFSDPNVKYIVARTERTNNKGSQIADILVSGFKTSTIPYTELNISQVNIDTLKSMVAQDSVMLIFANSESNQVKPILSKIKLLNIERMSIFGYDNWDLECLSLCPNTYYYSVFNEKADISAYELEYHKWFGYRDSDILRAYDLIGYDILSLALNIVLEPKSDLYTNNMNEAAYIQTVPVLKYKNNRGYVNSRYYMYYYDGKNIVRVK